MLLCCFKENKSPSSGQKRRRSPGKHDPDDQEIYVFNGTASIPASSKRNSVISTNDTPHDPSKGGRKGVVSSNGKERAPLQREERRLLKQRSHESVGSLASPSGSSGQHAPLSVVAVMGETATPTKTKFPYIDQDSVGSGKNRKNSSNSYTGKISHPFSKG